jgi:hypothetical protein
LNHSIIPFRNATGKTSIELSYVGLQKCARTGSETDLTIKVNGLLPICLVIVSGTVRVLPPVSETVFRYTERVAD